MKLHLIFIVYINRDLHREAEDAIAKYHDAKEAVLYSSLFHGNGFIETSTTEKDLIISDDENHVSLIYGVRLSKAKRLLYDHLN